MSWKVKEEKAKIARKRALDVLKTNYALHLVDNKGSKLPIRANTLPKLKEKPTMPVMESQPFLPTIKSAHEDAVPDLISENREYSKCWSKTGKKFRHKFSGAVVSEYFFSALQRGKKVAKDQILDFSEAEKNEIPSGWKALKDKTSQELYYWNIFTNETQWNPP